MTGTYEQLSVYFKPLFHIFLIVLYYISVKQPKVLVLVFFITTMFAEFLFSIRIPNNLSWSFICHSISFLSGTTLLYPLIKKSDYKFKGATLIGVILLLLTLGYIVVSIYTSISNKLINNPFYALVTIMLLVFTSCCFYLTTSYKHQKITILFIVAVSLIINCGGGVIRRYYSLNSDHLSAIFINLFEVLYELAFAYFMIKYDEISKQKEWSI